MSNYINCLPNNITSINVSNQDLIYLPDLSRFKNLEVLHCYGNKLTSLPSLNENLKELYCSYNQLTSLPSLNENLKILNCSNNQLTSLPSLNDKFISLKI